MHGYVQLHSAPSAKAGAWPIVATLCLAALIAQLDTAWSISPSMRSAEISRPMSGCCNGWSRQITAEGAGD
jgi:hypothetical protein